MFVLTKCIASVALCESMSVSVIAGLYVVSSGKDVAIMPEHIASKGIARQQRLDRYNNRNRICAIVITFFKGAVIGINIFISLHRHVLA